jgi:hypothetical protein
MIHGHASTLAGSSRVDRLMVSAGEKRSLILTLPQIASEAAVGA